ncbi:acyltransferase family protein [Mucilaginibacter lappiensis]|uniref:Peptidoglycan/LPS O-acetylase OafA/YrhL n=1 Tax=Mucilaginibacter lappiensis TaxID=354630 RepID=A0A841JCI6_9SPHI|nr:acyltransferase [Mucilaginibacter lappiensis]MBB6126185.1 peptidoglycan/LPS O-acetylase OafA/YrhL [Mucilaginibacter lappiensis]
MKEDKPMVVMHPRYKQLDSLRGLAALSVFFIHIIGKNAVDNPYVDFLKRTPVGIVFNGGAAVMFFFVLSGFVLSLPFVNNEKPLKLTAFYIKRVFRIYPALILAIVLSVLLKEFVYDKFIISPIPDIQSGEWGGFWNWHWNKEHIHELIKTFVLTGPEFNFNLLDPPIWSLVIEMKISILLPFFIMIIARSSAVLNVIFLIIMVCLTYDHAGVWPIGVFYLGILMAKYKDQITNTIQSWPLVILILACCLGIFLYNIGFEFAGKIQQHYALLSHTWNSYIIAVGSCIMMMIVLAKKRLSLFFEHSVFTFLGNISYSFYLIHMPLVIAMSSVFVGRYAFGGLYTFITAFLFALIISYLMLVFIEKPFQRISTKLISRFKVLNSIPI